MVNGWRQALAALAAAVVWGWIGGAAGVDLFTVAKTGDTAPGAGGGANFTNFAAIIHPQRPDLFAKSLDMNEAGEVTFLAKLSDSGEGIWTSGPTGLELVVRTGNLAPGAAGGATFADFRVPVLNGAGEVAFHGRLSDGKDGIWVADPGGLALVALDGDPGTPGVVEFDIDSRSNPALNEAGEVAFVVDFSRDSDPFAVPDQVILVGGPGDLQQIQVIENIVVRPRLNAAGDMAFLGGFVPDPTEAPTSAIWFGRPGNVFRVARTGGRPPGIGGEATYGYSIPPPALNGAGEVAFSADLSNGGGGLWIGRPDSPVLLARDGDPAPASGRRFKSFGTPVLNGNGQVLFGASLSGGVDAIYLGDLSNLYLVARVGDPAPGAGQGVTFATLETRALSEAGDVLFSATLSDSRRSHWFAGPGDPELIVADGSVIEVAPGDLRTVAPDGVRLFPSFGQEGGDPGNFNGRGQVAFTASFTDGTEGVFLTPPPTPPEVIFRPSQGAGKAWRRVSLRPSLTKPVVIAGPPGFQDRQPGVVRLRRVTGESFQIRFDEWQYLDGKHAEERLAFLVMEKGRVTLADGSIWEAGTVKVRGNDTWKRKAFTEPFPGRPQLFLTLQSFNDRAPVAVRAQNVTRAGFEAALFEEESKLETRHRRETVGYLAVFSAAKGGTVAGGFSGTDYELKRTRVRHKFKTVLGQKIKLEEEKSADRERRHARERVSVMRLGSAHFAQQISNKERDTTALRRR